MRTILIASLSTTVVIATGCPQQSAPKAPEAPQKAAPASAPASAPAGSAASRPASAPAGGAATANAAPFAGVLTLAKGIAPDSVKPSDVLFIMARQSAGGMPGRLIAVQRHVGVKFPMRYEISAKNLMMPGTPFSGPFIVQARIDRDGDPMTKGNDDLYAQAPGPVKGGESNVALVLGPRKSGGAASQPAAAPKKPGAASQPQ